MSKIEENFRKQAEMFADETRETPEDKFQTRHDYLAGCEYTYQYTFENMIYHIRQIYVQNNFKLPSSFEEDLKDRMEE